MNLAASRSCDGATALGCRPSPGGFSADAERTLHAVNVRAGTVHRRAEVLSLRAGDLAIGEAAVFFSRKGGKRGPRELPWPAYAAIRPNLADVDKYPATMAPDESVWLACARGQGISSATFCGASAATWTLPDDGPPDSTCSATRLQKLHRDAGEPIQSVSAFLDHSSLAVTTTYLPRLEGEADRTWPDVERRFAATCRDRRPCCRGVSVDAWKLA